MNGIDYVFYELNKEYIKEGEMLTTQEEYKQKYFRMLMNGEYEKLMRLGVKHNGIVICYGERMLLDDEVLSTTLVKFKSHIEEDFGIDFKKWEEPDCASTFLDASLLACNLNPEDFRLTEDCDLEGFTLDNEWLIPWVIKKHQDMIESVKKREVGVTTRDPLVARGIKERLKHHGIKYEDYN